MYSDHRGSGQTDDTACLPKVSGAIRTLISTVGLNPELNEAFILDRAAIRQPVNQHSCWPWKKATVLSLTGRIEQRTGTHAGLRRQASQVPITLVGTLPSSEESGRPNRLELERDTPRDANPAFIERAAVSGAMHTPAKSKIMVTTSPCDVLPHWNATLTVPQSFKTRLHTKIVTAPQRHRRLRLG